MGGRGILVSTWAEKLVSKTNKKVTFVLLSSGNNRFVKTFWDQSKLKQGDAKTNHKSKKKCFSG